MHPKSSPSAGKAPGFTLVEVMLVVATIALLASIAIPSYQRARRRSQTGAMINELRTTADAFQIFASERRVMPPDGANQFSVLPTGMADFLPDKSTWTRVAPGGGFWAWQNFTPVEVWGFTGTIGIYNPSLSPEQLNQIDTAMDDGNPTTGGVRCLSGWVYLGVK